MAKRKKDGETVKIRQCKKDDTRIHKKGRTMRKIRLQLKKNVDNFKNINA